MEVFGEDVLIGDFRASDNGFTTCSFEYDGSSEDELFAVDTTEDFLGESPYATYEGQKYSFKLEAQITLMKDLCMTPEVELTEYECRNVMRQITGKRGYQWMRFVTRQIGEDIWYKVRVVGVKLKRIAGKAVGLIINVETDSYMSYSEEYSITTSLIANEESLLYVNSDDLQNYVLPKVKIIPLNSGTFRLYAAKDVVEEEGEAPLLRGTQLVGYTTILENVTEYNEIFMDSKYKLLNGILLDNFNMNWIRLLPGENVFVPNMDCIIQFIYRCPRKVGFICR